MAKLLRFRLLFDSFKKFGNKNDREVASGDNRDEDLRSFLGQVFKDHKNPKDRGGSDQLKNLQPLQWEENREKGAKSQHKGK